MVSRNNKLAYITQNDEIVVESKGEENKVISGMVACDIKIEKSWLLIVLD